jgi:hypothetical protein
MRRLLPSVLNGKWVQEQSLAVVSVISLPIERIYSFITFSHASFFLLHFPRTRRWQAVPPFPSCLELLVKLYELGSQVYGYDG